LYTQEQLAVHEGKPVVTYIAIDILDTSDIVGKVQKIIKSKADSIKLKIS